MINLDPANDHVPYDCAVNVSDLITLEESMDELKLGPNGGMMYCMEFLEKNFDWLEDELKALGGTWQIAITGQQEWSFYKIH